MGFNSGFNGLNRGKHFGRACSPQHSGAATPLSILTASQIGRRQSSVLMLQEPQNANLKCGKSILMSVFFILRIELHKQTLPIGASRRFPTKGMFTKAPIIVQTRVCPTIPTLVSETRSQEI